MPHLHLTLLGAFQARLDNQPLTTFHSAKVQGLLAYLAVEAARPHARESLTALFWPDDAPQSAQQSLRQALYALRRTLGDGDKQTGEPFLLVTRQTVQVNPAASVVLDVAAFLQQVQQGNPEQAAALYTAELLTGLTTDSAPFEEWLRTTRQYLHNLALNALNQLTQQQLDHGDYRQAALYARRQLTLEPWHEEAHRQVMTALAHNGDRSAALAQYESCRRVLAEELGVDPAEETIGLYEQIRSGQLRGQTARANPFPASRSRLEGHRLTSKPSMGEEPPATRNNLPPQPTPFIGRKTDLEQIATRIDDPTCRLLTIVGPGGMGKTRLAIAAAQSILERELPVDNLKSKIANPKFEDGIFFVALAGVDSSDLLVSTIASALDFTFYGSGDPKTQLLDYLRTKTLLLLLDNCEHLLDGIELVADLLAVAPKLKVLATSREPLNLREEWLHALSGMSFPRTGENGTMLEQYTAVQLFVQCARRMKPAFDLAAESRAVVQICQLVDGMPLGIELAATWLKFYGCPQIIQKMQRSLDFLATTLRNLPARHRSMRAVFEHSWQLLTPAEQQVLRQLAVFRGGFTPAAAAQVTGAPLPLLLTLVEKSLLQLNAAHRFQLHELLRQFAEEKLRADTAEEERAQDAHCRYYCTWLGQQEVHLKGPGHLTARSAVETEIENVRAAWERAVAHEHLDELDCAIESLSYLYQANCWYEQGIMLFRHTAEALTPHKSNDRCRILFALILIKQAQMQNAIIGDMNRAALRESTEALLIRALFDLQNDVETVAYGEALWQLSNLRTLNNIPGQGEARLTALSIFEKANDHWRVARVLNDLGFFANLAGQHELAIQYYERSITHCKQIGNQRVLGDTLAIYSEALRALGEYAEALRLAQASLEVRSAAGNKRGIAFSLYLLGDLAWRLGNLEDALHYSKQSVALFTEIGVLYGLDAALNNLGNIACTLGDLVEARRQFALILQPKLKDNSLMESNLAPWALVGMAEVARQERQPAAAIELLEQVLRHPNAWQEAKERATKLLAELEAILPMAVVAAAQRQGRTGDLRLLVGRLLGRTL